MRHQQPRRPAVLRREPLAAPLERDQVIGSIQVRQRQVGRELLFGDDEAKRDGGLEPRALEQELHRHAFEGVIQPAPGRDAMHVANDGLAWQREQLVVGYGEGPLDLAGYGERPLGGVDAGNVAVVQDGPLGRGDLAGGDAGSQAQAWARYCTAPRRSDSLGPSFRMGSTPKAPANPLTTAATLSFHNCSPLPAPSSRSTDVITTPGMPHGTIRSKCVRSVATCNAKPCHVTHCYT